MKPQDLERKLGETIAKRKPIKKTQEKYIDDMTQAVSIDLRLKATIDFNPTHPLQYHERTGHVLPVEDNVLQLELERLMKYAEEHEMLLNESKTKVMIFNNATRIDIMPKLSPNNENIIEVVEEMKLLDIIINNNLSWKSNTDNLTKKGWARMWWLRRLKSLGASDSQLMTVYIQQIRSVMEMACPVWHPGLTVHEARSIERIQKTALAIIRGQSHSTYRDALAHFELDSLKQRRENLCLNFAKKAFKSDKFNSWFCYNDKEIQTRSIKMPLKKVKCRTKRYEKSPIPYLTKLLNEHLHENNQSDRTLNTYRSP